MEKREVTSHKLHDQGSVPLPLSPLTPASVKKPISKRRMF
jgi:hypothetical protein